MTIIINDYNILFLITFAIIEIGLRLCVLGYKNLIIINGRNIRILLIVKKVFMGAYYGYYMIYLSKNLVSDVRENKTVKLFWVID